ncbi:hypothetical protein [Pedobacter steynii]
MACLSIPRFVPPKCQPLVIGGVSKLYLLRAQDIKPLSDGNDYDITNNVITDVEVKNGTYFVEIGLINNALDVIEAVVPTNYGTSYLTQQVTLKLTDISEGNQRFIKQIRGQNLVVLVKSRNENYYILGLKKNLMISNLQASTGLNSSDEVGYTITFNSSDSLGLKVINQGLIDDLIAVPLNAGFPYTLPFRLS